MKVNIHNDKTNANWEEVKEVYASAGWNKHTIEIIQKVFEASQLAVFATIDNRIVGIGRAMTDGVFNASIYDVVVHKDYQELGIGKKIMENLLGQLQEISCVHIIATTGNEGFYRKLGLKKAKTAMARYLNPSLAKEYLE
ncbi:GNAT family N-acetyltransferase [Fictibacillus gelatini]|uniref:GNAT family N-acetyltransferase n=1 Tax=Fictibacillus gelatini TaxID=225985 RepID=UPI000404E1A2|nr:GNAT family N-acetyltransferase [Fictibacillus gelatini]